MSGPADLPPFLQRRAEAMPPRERSTALPERLPAEDYPGLRHLLDEVAVSGFWVQRVALAWLPAPPRGEALELAWLESALVDLEQAARVARAKVRWRREVAEARDQRDRDARAAEFLDEQWSAQS